MKSYNINQKYKFAQYLLTSQNANNNISSSSVQTINDGYYLAFRNKTAENYIEKEGSIQLILLPDFQFQLEEYYQGDRIAAKKGQLQLIYFVNAVIDEVLESGQYMEWYKEAEDLAQSLGL